MLIGAVPVAVVCDDRLFREGLSRILASESGLTLVGSLESFPPGGVVLLDSRIERALERCVTLALDRGARVVCVGAPADDAWAEAALDAGARGILATTFAPQDLVGAIRVVFGGSVWAPRRVVVARMDRLASRERDGATAGTLLEEHLSAREREVLREAATGLGNKELADRLSISEATVKVHLTHIFRKLGLSGRGELVAAYHGAVPARVPRHGRGTLLGSGTASIAGSTTEGVIRRAN